MARSWLPFMIFYALSVTAAGQLNIQSLLNQFCARNPSKPGCLKPVDILRPEVLPPAPEVVIETCSASSRECPQLSVCVPKSIPCSIIGSAQRCEIPVGSGFRSQILLCGDGQPPGFRCADRDEVPVLTQMIIQCQSANLVNTEPVKRLESVQGPGQAGGAGVYRCGTSGSWVPLFDSPPLADLTHSCRNSECGMLPQPDKKMPIHRPWSWVRAIYFRNRVYCTGTIVSPTAILTAAHCLTRSQVSRQAHSPQDFQVELPGPTNQVQRLSVTPHTIHIHPRYRPQARRQHDLALMFFKRNDDFSLPIACIADGYSPQGPPRASFQVVFRLEEGSTERSTREAPVWTTSPASWDSTCRVVGSSSSGNQDQLVLLPSQFCASHPGLTMVKGSSGGPFLAEVGTSVQEVWVLLGVLSSFSNGTSSMQTHSIYSKVAEDSNWIKSCVFDGQCEL